VSDEHADPLAPSSRARGRAAASARADRANAMQVIARTGIRLDAAK